MTSDRKVTGEDGRPVRWFKVLEKFLFLFCIAFTIEPIEAQTVSHVGWDSLLKNYVSSDGRVNYKYIKANKNRLDEYLKRLSQHPPADHWPINEQKAYWINVYNAFTVSLIIRHYPVKSIKDIGNGRPWDIPFVTIGIQAYSLNQIEHDILRKRFNDPRIHFAIVCASKSCPILRRQAYFADQLDEQLDDQTRRFIRDKIRNTITPYDIRISKIFEWFRDDFVKSGTLIGFLNKYAHTTISGGAAVTYHDYDWSLNE